MRRGLAAVVTALLGVSGTACVSVRHVADPTAALFSARAEAERLGAQPGRAHRLNVLVFDADEGQLVRVSVPIWLASKFEGQLRRDDQAGRALERGLGADFARHIRLKDVAAAGRGLIAAVEDDDGSQVLVWLR
jgi:hypothetical protein